MTFDLHTHTTYSHGTIRPHGKGTVAENAEAAARRGLRELAISDHGPGHLFYGIRRDQIPLAREEVRREDAARPDLKVWFSVEANIMDTENGLDVPKAEQGAFDFLLAGYHYGVRQGHCLANWTSARVHAGESAARRLARVNTDLYLRAIYENDLKVLTHPGDKAPVYMEEVAKACADRGTWMEISTRHAHLTLPEIQVCMKEDVRFIISSDAHSPARVGEFEGGLARARAAGLDLTRIVNIEPAPDEDACPGEGTAAARGLSASGPDAAGGSGAPAVEAGASRDDQEA